MTTEWEMSKSDIQFTAEWEYAMLCQNTGETLRGPSYDRDSLFTDGPELVQARWRRKGIHVWFYSSDVEDQTYPMVCRRRPVHVYRGDWA